MERTASLFAIAIVSLGLAGCDYSEGRDLKFEEAQTYFSEHEAQLREIMAQIEVCRPVYASEGVYNAIRLRDPDGDPVCANGNVQPVNDIKAAMKSIGIVIVDFTLSAEGAIRNTTFTLYNAGLAVSGVEVSIEFYANEGVVVDGSLSNGMERRALDASPHHWFWNRWAT